MDVMGWEKETADEKWKRRFQWRFFPQDLIYDRTTFYIVPHEWGQHLSEFKLLNEWKFRQLHRLDVYIVWARTWWMGCCCYYSKSNNNSKQKQSINLDFLPNCFNSSNMIILSLFVGRSVVRTIFFQFYKTNFPKSFTVNWKLWCGRGRESGRKKYIHMSMKVAQQHCIIHWINGS